MKIPFDDCSFLTAEKVDFVEEQANKRLNFAISRREFLVKEAHTTLQWLFGIIVGASGYLVTLIREGDSERAVVTALVFAALAAAGGAAQLMYRSLMTASMIPPGNIPSNLVTMELMSHEAHVIRLAEACNLEERIAAMAKSNHRSGDAINMARWFVISVPLVSAIIALGGVYAA